MPASHNIMFSAQNAIVLASYRICVNSSSITKKQSYTSIVFGSMCDSSKRSRHPILLHCLVKTSNGKSCHRNRKHLVI